MGLTQITTGGVDDNINIDSNTLKVDGTNNRVGIGTSSPATNLHITGSGDTIARVTSADGSGAFLDLGDASDPDGGRIVYDSGSNLAFSTASTERLRIDSSGRLLVGASSSSANTRLIVAGNSGTPTAAADFRLQRGSANPGSGVGLGAMYFTDSNEGIGASIIAQADSAWAAGDYPTRLLFSTTADGASGPTERMRIDNSGRFFFNENSSDLNHKYILSGNESSDLAAFQYNSNTGTYLAILTGPPNGIVEIKADARSGSFPPLTFKTGANERMRINSSGNVGIGTSSPGGKLAIAHTLNSAYATTSRNNTFLQVHNPSTTSGCYAGIEIAAQGVGNDSIAQLTAVDTGSGNTDFVIGLRNSSTFTERMRINSLGNVGIGTSSPGVNGLHVRNSSEVFLRLDHSTSNTWDISNDSNLKFSRGGTERMRIDGSGRLLVGTSSSFFDASNLQVFNSNFCAAFKTNSGSNKEVIRFVNGVDGVGTISTSTTTTTYNTSSDYRLKENIVDVTDGITRVKQLQPKRFNFIADNSRTVDGFIAHEAQTVVPEAVTGTHDEVDDDNNPVYQGIDQSKLVPLLTAALQEAIAKIETLETKVAALEAG